MNYRHLLWLPLLALPLLSGCAAPVVMGAAAAGAVVVSQDERSAATIAADEAIELKVADLMSQQPGINEQGHINITCINGVVLLTGEAPQKDELQQLQEATGKLEKVREVRNEVVVGPASSMESRSQDSWITTKIKSRLVAERNIRTNRFKVVTEQQTVYLMGMVTKHEGYVAATIARDIRGVKRVVKMFEYLD